MVEIDANGCWIWQGRVGEKGYGQVRTDDGIKPAHQAAYREWKGDLPESMEPDHICRVRRCVNPDHLEAVTHRENLLRSESFSGRNARKTHCPSSHPYAGENLIIKVDARGNQARYCRACRAARNRAR